VGPVFVADGTPVPEALARTTDLGIGAHPDDLELVLLPAIVHAHEAEDRWFTGVVCTDGAGAARGGPFAELDDVELAAVRRAEQEEAARIGGYGALVPLGRSSASVRDPEGHRRLVADLTEVLAATRPAHVFTHNPADKHDTHVAVVTAVVLAARSLPAEDRPYRLIGCEGWRDLDWLPDDEKVRLDVSDAAPLADRLAAAFRSQVEGGKRYDLAVVGRRRANATLDDPRSVDVATQVVVGMDLSPLVHNPDIDPVRYVTAAIDRFRDDVSAALARWLP
jgi:LmbE family N-acetylglucosaminyl deacetylase